MYRIATALTLATAIALAPVMTPVAQAQAKSKNASSLEIPITGIGGTLANPTSEKFAGTFTLQRFVNDNGKLLAVGTVSGTVTDSLGNVLTTGLQTVALPVVASQEGAGATAVPGVTVAATCPILNFGTRSTRSQPARSRDTPEPSRLEHHGNSGRGQPAGQPPVRSRRTAR